MTSRKRKRPVAGTTDLVKRHYPWTDKSTNENYHSQRFAQADCLNNCFPLAEILPAVWEQLDKACAPQVNGGG